MKKFLLNDRITASLEMPPRHFINSSNKQQGQGLKTSYAEQFWKLQFAICFSHHCCLIRILIITVLVLYSAIKYFKKNKQQTVTTYSDPSSTSAADTFCPDAVWRLEVIASPTTVGIQRLRTDKREEKSVWFYSKQNVQIDFFSH